MQQDLSARRLFEARGPSRPRLPPQASNPSEFGAPLPFEFAELFRRASAIDAGELECEPWRFTTSFSLDAHAIDFTLATPASFELADAASAYEATRPGMGRAFLAQVERTLLHIQRASASVLASGLRRALVIGFPYCLIYRQAAEGSQLLGLLPLSARSTSFRASGPASSASSLR